MNSTLWGLFMFRHVVRLSLALLAAALLAACTDLDQVGGEPWDLSTTPSGGSPADAPILHDTPGRPDAGPPPGDDGRGAGDPPVDPDEVDLLWVIDNSGSMCEEQEALRSSFRQFIDALRESSTDLHVAVTTTQGSDAFFERIAEPGRLQATPHPPVGFGGTCKSPERVCRQIEAAVACTKNPGKFQDLLEWEEEHFECALEQDAEACAEVGWDPDDASIKRLFPCGQTDADGDGNRCSSRKDFEAIYRDIPKVLAAEDYRRSDGTLNIDQLQRDFACMSYVGTRGSAKEQGLRAATRAVSPEMTGGPVESPTDPSAPNHGFLRQTARTAVMFVSDENDCSKPDDANLEEKYPRCGEMGCYFAARQGKSNPSPLYATGELARQFRENLRASKKVSSLAADEIVVGSLHGSYAKYGSISGQKVPSPGEGCTSEQLSQTNLREKIDICATETLGAATSGDRYEHFLLDFDHHFPSRRNDDGHLKGWMCEPGGFGIALEQFAETLRRMGD